MYMYVDIVPGLTMFCLTDFVQGLSYKGVQDRQVSVVIFFFFFFFHMYIFFFFFFFALLLVWVTLSVVIKIIITINK